MMGMTMAYPPGWVDRSMMVYSAAGADRTGVAPNMVVTRDVMPGSLPPSGTARLDSLLDAQVAQMRDNLAGLREEARLVDEQAHRAEVTVHWNNGGTALTQWVSFYERGGGVLIVATATAGRSTWPEHEPTFRRMRESLTLPA